MGENGPEQCCRELHKEVARALLLGARIVSFSIFRNCLPLVIGLQRRALVGV